MKRVLVCYLKNNDLYTDGQSIVEDKSLAMMPSDRIHHYLSTAAARGLTLDFEASHLDVDDEEAELYAANGFSVIDLPS